MDKPIPLLLSILSAGDGSKQDATKRERLHGRLEKRMVRWRVGVVLVVVTVSGTQVAGALTNMRTQITEGFSRSISFANTLMSPVSNSISYGLVHFAISPDYYLLAILCAAALPGLKTDARQA